MSALNRVLLAGEVVSLDYRGGPAKGVDAFGLRVERTYRGADGADKVTSAVIDVETDGQKLADLRLRDEVRVAGRLKVDGAPPLVRYLVLADEVVVTRAFGCYLCGEPATRACDPCGRRVCRGCSARRSTPACLDAIVCDACAGGRDD